jgi:hypothetical protein
LGEPREQGNQREGVHHDEEDDKEFYELFDH